MRERERVRVCVCFEEYLILCVGVILLNHLLEEWTLLPGNDSSHKKEI